MPTVYSTVLYTQISTIDDQNNICLTQTNASPNKCKAPVIPSEADFLFNEQVVYQTHTFPQPTHCDPASLNLRSVLRCHGKQQHHYEGFSCKAEFF